VNVIATILLAAVATTSAPPARTAAELHALPNEAFAKGVRFSLEGTVVFVPTKLIFFLADETGGICIRPVNGDAVRPGDVVRVTGVAKLNCNKDMTLFGHMVQRTGRTTPPECVEATAYQISRGDCDWHPVRIKGLVRDAFRDEIDPPWIYLVLNCDSHIVYAAFQDDALSEKQLADLVDAKVSVMGACRPSSSGKRLFLGRHIMMSGPSDMVVLERAPADPFAAPLLDELLHAQPDSVLSMKRRRAIGSVIAVWHENRFLLETDSGRLLRVEVSAGARLPSYGDGVEVVGFPETDLYRINLSRAVFRPAKATLRRQAPQEVTPGDILKTPDGRTKINTDFYGRTIRIRGLVRSLPQPDGDDARMSLECGGYLVPVDTSACPELIDDISPGTELEITGACIFDTDDWHPPATFPRINEFLLVIRQPGDIKVVSRPSWWTPGRLLVIIGALLAALGGIAVWNRMLNRIVDRRTSELTKERLAHDGADLKVEERTRLAVELHDTLAQNLTGISLQIDAAQMAAEENPNSVMPYLETARRKMQNCRENLRNCLWDLRSRAFEEKSLAEAIRKTIAPHVGDAEIQVDVDIPCRKLSDNAIHAVLCIVRELVLNAVRHGRASRIRIAGQLENSGMSLTVADNGVGFDPASRPGMAEGHFGLQGISERARRLGGTFEISSAPGQGAVASLRQLSPEP